MEIAVINDHQSPLLHTTTSNSKTYWQPLTSSLDLVVLSQVQSVLWTSLFFFSTCTQSWVFPLTHLLLSNLSFWVIVFQTNTMAPFLVFTPMSCPGVHWHLVSNQQVIHRPNLLPESSWQALSSLLLRSLILSGMTTSSSLWTLFLFSTALYASSITFFCHCT